MFKASKDTLEYEFKQWLESLKHSQLIAKRRTATDLHCSLASYFEEALRLQFLQDEKKKKKGFIVGEALKEYLPRWFEIPAAEFEKLVKPTYTLKQIENMVKDYCKIVKREVNKEILAVIYYDWEKERDIVHRVKVFLENTFKVGYTDITKHELEKIRELQAKIHYGLFGDILDLHSDFSLEWFTRKLHDKKFRRKLDNLTKILSKAEKVVADIQLSKESYLKSGKA